MTGVLRLDRNLPPFPGSPTADPGPPSAAQVALLSVAQTKTKPAFPVLAKQNGILNNALEISSEQTASPYMLVDADFGG